MNEKIKAETHGINERFQKMETRLTACVDGKVDMSSKQHERKWTKAMLKSWPFSQKKQATPILGHQRERCLI